MSEPFDPSFEQRQILESREQRIAIVASAGAGKTRVLVERYLAHVLREGIDPDRILTITFTRKAAAEMKERIVRGLRDAGAYDQAQIAETGPIQTIHSLCEQILRENAVSAGIDTKFEILAEAQSSRMQTEAIEESIATLGEESAEAESLITSLAGKRSYGRTSPYSLLQSSILNVLNSLRGAGLERSDIAEIYADPRNLQRFCQESVLAQQPSPVAEAYRQIEGPDWRENLKLAYRGLRVAVPNWLKSIPEVEEDRALETSSCGVVQIALEAWDLLESRMRASQQFDFCELESLVVKLLSTHPEIQARLNAKYEIVMVDEAQDLNHGQYRLLEFLCGGKLLTVGDGQQSIYGFRHADLERFQKAHSIDAKKLTKNWRSTKGILSFIDRVFSSTWPNTYLPMGSSPEFDLDHISVEDYSGIELWEVPNDLSANASYIGRMLDEGVKHKHICVLARDSKSCQIIHEALTKEGIDSKIHGGTEKFYTRMEVRDLANMLRALSDPYDDYSLLAVLRGPAVNVSVDGMVRLGLRKPVIENLSEAVVSDDDRKRINQFQEWFDPLRAYADRLSAWEVLTEIFSLTPFLSAISEADPSLRQLANVRKLLVLASQDSHLGPLEFAEQIREIQELKHKEGDAEQIRDPEDVVRIMTIHKAKGLEFPIVVLPDTNKKLVKPTSEVLVDPNLKLVAAKFGGKGNGLLYKFLEERKKGRELEEELRVLYVAMTRAQTRLCISLYPATSHDTVSKRIRKIVGEPPHESIRLREPIQIA